MSLLSNFWLLSLVELYTVGVKSILTGKSLPDLLEQACRVVRVHGAFMLLTSNLLTAHPKLLIMVITCFAIRQRFVELLLESLNSRKYFLNLVISVKNPDLMFRKPLQYKGSQSACLIDSQTYIPIKRPLTVNMCLQLATTNEPSSIGVRDWYEPEADQMEEDARLVSYIHLPVPFQSATRRKTTCCSPFTAPNPIELSICLQKSKLQLQPCCSQQAINLKRDPNSKRFSSLCASDCGLLKTRLLGTRRTQHLCFLWNREHLAGMDFILLHALNHPITPRHIVRTSTLRRSLGRSWGR